MTLRHLISPEERRKKLRKALEAKRLIRGIEVHSGISALISNDLRVELESSGQKKINEFDFFWESSLTDSASKGYPDVEIISFDSRLRTISEILEVSDKPMVVDGDTGGDIHHFEYLVPKLERLGVSAVIIEDKIFPKRNSLDSGACQEQEDPDKFSRKIEVGKRVQRSEDFMIIARIESLIARRGVDDALMRARKYLEAGADGIMIHSNSKSPEEIFAFSSEYLKLCRDLNLKKPLVCVPTTYNSVRESELEESGFNMVIYANHMLRASYKAMQEAGKIILRNERSLEAEPCITPVKEIFEKVGFLDITEKDKKMSLKPAVIIPAAGENPELKNFLGDIPKPLLKIHGKSILEHQISAFNALGLNEIYVVTGYQKEKFNVPGATYIENLEYSGTGMLSSLMKARDKMRNGFIYISSDILFDEKLLKDLLGRKEDMVIVVDDSYLYHKHEVDKMLNAVVTKCGRAYQRLRVDDDEVMMIGTNIPKEMMTCEFIGLAKFSKRGAEILTEVYDNLKQNHSGKFHEAENFDKAFDTDIFQEMINRGMRISVHETHGGWLEIHNQKDLEFASDILKTGTSSDSAKNQVSHVSMSL